MSTQQLDQMQRTLESIHTFLAQRHTYRKCDCPTPHEVDLMVKELKQKNELLESYTNELEVKVLALEHNLRVQSKGYSISALTDAQATIREQQVIINALVGAKLV